MRCRVLCVVVMLREFRVRVCFVACACFFLRGGVYKKEAGAADAQHRVILVFLSFLCVHLRFDRLVFYAGRNSVHI